MYKNLISYIEPLVKQKVELLPRGSKLISDLEMNLPPSWRDALTLRTTIADAIHEIWLPAHSRAKNIATALTDRTIDIALVIMPLVKASPSLIYIFQDSSKSQTFGWLAGLPVTKEDIDKTQARLGGRLPKSYTDFSQIHNGFLRDGWSNLGLRPLDKAYFLSTLNLADSNSIISEYSQMLAVCGDGTGNEQCYNLAMPRGNNDFWTVDWDHETREIGERQSLWQFLDKFIARQMYIADGAQ